MLKSGPTAPTPLRRNTNGSLKAELLDNEMTRLNTSEEKGKRDLARIRKAKWIINLYLTVAVGLKGLVSFSEAKIHSGTTLFMSHCWIIIHRADSFIWNGAFARMCGWFFCKYLLSGAKIDKVSLNVGYIIINLQSLCSQYHHGCNFSLITLEWDANKLWGLQQLPNS